MILVDISVTERDASLLGSVDTDRQTDKPSMIPVDISVTVRE